MELPDLGKHCFYSECSRLDFLPVKCDACNKIFCKDHYVYAAHNCPLAYTKDNQVPVCPLCNQPVSILKGESPDQKVSDHMDNDCKSERRLKKKNKCLVRGCKQIELVPVLCQNCGLNYCLKHRHEQDHNCQARERQQRQQNQLRSQTNINPINYNQPSLQSNRTHIQANMSEEEALTRAIEASLTDSRKTVVPSVSENQDRRTQEDADRELAQALAESLQDANKSRTTQQTREGRSGCTVS